MEEKENWVKVLMELKSLEEKIALKSEEENEEEKMEKSKEER